MKKQVLFIHSAGPQGQNKGSNYLLTYLQCNLDGAYRVLFPTMTKPENPQYDLWKTRLEQALDVIEGEVILVGHSLGGSVLLKYLSEASLHKSVAGLFLVAAPYWGKKEWEVDEFVLQEDFAPKLPQNTPIFLYHSTDDDIVPFSHLTSYASKLPKAIVRELDNYGHFFRTGLPELIEDIKNL